MSSGNCNGEGKMATRADRRGGRGAATDGSAVPSEADPPAVPGSATSRAMADPAAPPSGGDGDAARAASPRQQQNGDGEGLGGEPAAEGSDLPDVPADGTRSDPRRRTGATSAGVGSGDASSAGGGTGNPSAESRGEEFGQDGGAGGDGDGAPRRRPSGAGRDDGGKAGREGERSGPREDSRRDDAASPAGGGSASDAHRRGQDRADADEETDGTDYPVGSRVIVYANGGHWGATVRGRERRRGRAGYSMNYDGHAKSRRDWVGRDAVLGPMDGERRLVGPSDGGGAPDEVNAAPSEDDASGRDGPPGNDDGDGGSEGGTGGASSVADAGSHEESRDGDGGEDEREDGRGGAIDDDGRSRPPDAGRDGASSSRSALLLRSSLASHSASSAVRQAVVSVSSPGASSPPTPPPFLSHGEECALRTALAFVLARRRRRGGRGKDECGGGISGAGRRGGDDRGSAGDPPSGNAGGRTVPRTAGRTDGGGLLLRGGVYGRLSGREGVQSAPSAPFGGLLGLPPSRFSSRPSASTIPSDGKGGGTSPEGGGGVERVRDMLRLAVSAVLPLYGGALRPIHDCPSRGTEGHGGASTTAPARPCAVYDFESAASSLRDPATADGGRSTNAERHRESADGLCRAVLARVGGLLREESVRGRVGGRGGGVGGGNAMGVASGSASVRDSVADVLHELLGGGRRAASDRPSREAREGRILRVMASCHVVHRLVCLDGSGLVGTEAVKVACRLLTDLYRGTHTGRRRVGGGGTADGRGSSGDGGDGGTGSRGSEGGRPGSTTAKIAPPRWGQTPASARGGGSYADVRAGRQRRALARLTPRESTGGRRKRGTGDCANDDDDGDDPTPPPLPRIGDVLCVNLLRLLEGVASARLRRGEGRRGNDASAAAATRVLTEMRSSVGPELATPVELDDAAGFYAREMAGERRGRGSSPWAEEDGGDDCRMLLLPGAKIMLRQRMYELANGLSLYEG